MTRARPLLVALALLTTGLVPAIAGADTPYYYTYQTEYTARVTGNTVIVCDRNVAFGSCHGGPRLREGVFVRQEVSTGQTAFVNEKLLEPDRDLCPDELNCCRECRRDRCVAPGIYRYGWTPPLPHCGDLFVEVTVTLPLSPGCAPTASLRNNFQPQWANATERQVECPEKESGCAMAGGARTVLAIQSLAFALGCLWWFWRRRRRST